MFIPAANPTSHRLARLAFSLACLSALVVGASGLLHRLALRPAAARTIGPRAIEKERDECFRRVDRAAAALGSEIVARATAEGRLEAVATTRRFGCLADTVLHISVEGSGSRIDIRSKSRV